MKRMTRNELKIMAVSYGIYNGYHGRSISRMRKIDFIDYIRESFDTPTPTSPTDTLTSDTTSRSDNFIIHLISQLQNTPTRRNHDNELSTSRRRLEFGPLHLLDLVLGVLTDGEDETRNFTGQFPTEEESEQAHENIRCTVCLNNKICVLFQKCKHVVTCGICGLKVDKCPVCKNPIESSDRIRVFLP
jgi:hypothetical protein